MTEKLRRKWRLLAVRTKTGLALAVFLLSVAFTGALALGDAYIPWGDNRYLGTNNDIIDSNFPSWFGSAFKTGSGVWATNIPAWYVSPDNSNEASLEVLFNHALLSNSLIMKLGYLDSSNASLSLDLLLMTNQAVMSSNLFENILTGSGVDTSRTFNVPLTDTNAVGLQLRRGFGSITVRDSLLSPDSDGDGFSDVEESIWGSDPGSTYSVPCVAITGQVFYAGVQSGVIHVLAATHSNDWASTYYLTMNIPSLSQAASFTLSGLPLRHPYYARAWRDVNDNQTRDYWEPSGTATPDLLNLQGNTGDVVIVMADPDSDGDGMTDADELALGRDPLTTNTYPRLPFSEAFETNTVHAGDINGQNYWMATPPGSALIQTSMVYEGEQALEIKSDDATATACQLFAVSNAPVVWVDVYVQASEADMPTNVPVGSAKFFFDANGYLKVYDGLSVADNKWVTLTNVPPSGTTGAWVRVTTRLDYTAQRWLVCLDGVLAAEGLGFATPVSQFAMVSISGHQGGMDTLRVSTNMPADLSLDGDSLPDVWELAKFGNLDELGDADKDNDGLTNLEEYQWGTDPADEDSDADGMPDGWETNYGFEPGEPTEGASDIDADGLTNLDEYLLGTDPTDEDSDGDGMLDGWESAAGFNPLRSDPGIVPDQGLALWLRADDLVAGNAVAVWPDRGGRGHDLTQSVVALRPVVVTNAVNGRPVVDFDGANDSLSGRLGGITGAVSVVTVCRFDSLSQAAGDYDFVLGMGEDQLRKHLSVSRCASGYAAGWDNAYYSYMGGSAGSVRGPVLPGQYWLAIMAVHTATGTQHKIYVNGVEESVQQYTGPLTLDGRIDLGRFVKPGFTSHYFNGQLAEVFVYDRALGAVECQELYAYLQERYALKREERPEVDAGVDQQVFEGQPVSLNASVVDDGAPNPPGQVTCQWTKAVGPGEVSFADATATQTVANFSASGAYVLRLTASDGLLTSFDEMQVSVTIPASTNVPPTGLRLWLKADDLPLASGSPVAEWRDSSGQGHTVSQMVASSQPVFRTNGLAGRPVVDFDGANDSLSGQVGGITGSVSVVTVCRFEELNQAAGDYDYILRMGEDQNRKHFSVSRCAAGYAPSWDNAYYSYMGGSVGPVHGPALMGRQWLTIVAMHSASGLVHTVYVDGVPVSAQQYSGSLTLDGGIELGRFSKTGFANHYLHGQIAETLVYDRTLQPQDMLQLNVYLKAKYGVPVNSDLDGDGLSDEREAWFGTDPLVSNACARLPFTERFEPDTCKAGDIHGQNGWDVSKPQTAFVQSKVVYEGLQALAVSQTNEELVSVRHVYSAPSAKMIWMDARNKAEGTAIPTGTVEGAVAFTLNDKGNLVVRDGRLSGTNRWVTLTNHPPVTMGEWIRLSAGLDCESKTWLICLDGIKMAEGLGFCAPLDEMQCVQLQGAHANVDNLSISTTMPPGLSLDGDSLADDWETQYFGNLDQVDALDFDLDGVSNLDECHAGLNPISPDTDQDGLKDGWELAHGLNPLLTADAALDADQDGLSNLEESQHGTDMVTPDTDGDGVSDGTEVNTWHSNPLAIDSDDDGLPDLDEVSIYGTDPAQADSDHDGTHDLWTAVSKTGVATSRRTGVWAEEGGLLYALSNRHARLEYAVTVPADMYRIGIQVTNCDAQTTQPVTFSLHVLIDGMPIDWLHITVPAGTNSWAYLPTPWMSGGQHIVRFAWLDDYATNKVLGVEAVTLLGIDGPRTNQNGRQNWVNTNLAQNPERDTDGDGLSDLDELEVTATDPILPDTDGDALNDGEEVFTFGTDPLALDSNQNAIPDARLLASRTGIETSLRETRHRDSSWSEEGTSLAAYESASTAFYDVTVTNAGMYRLALQLRNFLNDPRDNYSFIVEASLNGCKVGMFNIFADYDLSGRGYVNTPWLVPGTYRIGIQWTNEFWAMGFRTTERDNNIAIEKVQLYEVEGADSDTNGVQDWMELALAAEGDSDNDGLTDKDEILVYHTHPLNKDTDGDGIADKDELDRGTNPNLPDTDGDGVTDGEEIRESLTDPLHPEFDGSVHDIDVVRGSHTNDAVGLWQVNGFELQSKCLRGSVDYIVNTPVADVFRIKINATHPYRTSSCSPIDPIAESDIQVYVDGRYMGKKHLVADGVDGSVVCFTPWLTPGPHTVRLFWENVHSRLSLKIKDIRLQQLGGPDANGNGIKDWVEATVLAQSVWDTPPAVSVVSPVCIEGAARHLDMMTITSCGTTGVVKNGILGRWYADVPLAPTGPTLMEGSFQGGSVVRSHNVTWVPLNLLVAENIIIRKNDALKLTAYPSGATNGEIRVLINGMTNAVTTVDSPLVCAFTHAGTYTVTGIYDQGARQTNSITVTVMDGAFPAEPPACMIGAARDWACTNLPATAVLEADPSIEIHWTNQIARIKMAAINEDHYLVARPYPNGPILASTRLDGFWIQGAVDSYVWVVAKYDDSQLWENTVVTKKVPPSVSIQIQIFVGGVTFDDLALERWLTVQDLSVTGEYKFRMIHPNSVFPSICHTIRAYQGNVFVGEAYYGGVMMPVE